VPAGPTVPVIVPGLVPGPVPAQNGALPALVPDVKRCDVMIAAEFRLGGGP